VTYSLTLLRLCALLLLLAPLQLRAEAVDDLLQALQPIERLQGEFQQRQYATDGEVVSESEGRFRLLRPGYFAWEIRAPDSQLIIANRDYLWHHDRDLETVTRRPVAGSEAMTPLQVLGGDSEALRRDYTVHRDEQQRFVLVPRGAGSGFQELALSLSGDSILGMEVRDNLNQRVVITFSALDTQTAMTPAEFDFAPPPGADLFYQAE
jgi:outer membrane lipoprotein carrier protein|tara:strand:+ start:7071 stop:7694 length:624 start_codon:yes stop_codon:yes gene_type:complete